MSPLVAISANRPPVIVTGKATVLPFLYVVDFEMRSFESESLPGFSADLASEVVALKNDVAEHGRE